MKIKTFISIIFFLILNSEIITAEIIISEIMAKPYQDYTLNEWIELYNDGTEEINISGWKIVDDGGEDNLTGGKYGGKGTIIPPKKYALITSETTRVYNNFKVLFNTTKIYSNDGTLGYYGLSDNGESIAIIDTEGNIIDNITYPSMSSEDWRNYSYSKENETSWKKTIPSPGYDNYNFFIEYNENECDWDITITLENLLINNGNNFEFGAISKNLAGQKTNITLKREIKNIFNETIKSYNSLIKEATYQTSFSGPWTPNLDPGVYFIKTEISTQCNDLDLENNLATKFFIIFDEKSEHSKINIENIYLGTDNKAKFGDNIRIKLDVYKGNTTKEEIKVYIEKNDKKITKITKFKIFDKFSNNSLTIPLQIFPNCNEKLTGGKYILYAEGIETSDKQEIIIEGLSEELCEIIVEKQIEIATTSSKTIINYSSSTINEKIYESNTKKSERYAIYLFSLVLVMVIIQLGIEKWKQ